MLLLAASERTEKNPLKIKFRKDIVESYKPIVWAEPHQFPCCRMSVICRITTYFYLTKVMTAKLTNCELSFLTEKRRNIALSRRRNLARKVIIRRNEISCLQDKNLSFDETEFRFNTKFRKCKVKFRLSGRRNFEKLLLQNTAVIITSLLYSTCKSDHY